jgi:formylglycine-generating enzyme required for sulfatase activity
LEKLEEIHMNKYFVMIGLCSLGILNSHAAESLASIGLKMVRIPSGTFVMGSCLKRELTKLEIEENARRAFMGQLPAAQLKDPCLVGKLDPLGSVEETPQHKVTVRSFFMGETKVTLGQFKKFIEAKGRADLLTTTFMNYHNTYGDSAPVHGVSWTDAQALYASGQVTLTSGT